MTNSRRAFQAFQERLAGEDNKPLWALAKGLFLAFIAFNLLMGFLLGTVPLARNIYFHFIFHVWNPVNTWFTEMGWEGQVTLFALNAAATLAVLYITRSYLALIVRGATMKLVDGKNWFSKNVLKRPNDATNVATISPRRAPVLKEEEAAPVAQQRSYTPPARRDESVDTAIVAG